MEARLTEIYSDAKREISAKWNAYMDQAAVKLEDLEDAYQRAKGSGDSDEIRKAGVTLAKEKKRQTVNNARYQAMVDQTTEKLADVNTIAVNYANGQMPRIYARNYNGTLQGIEGEVAHYGQYSFDLVDERTVRNLILSDDSLFPQKVINRPKDEAWNRKAINSQVLQGIFQGESIPQIAERLQNVTDMNEEAAIRNARTMTTAAENNGRLAGLREATDNGIVYEKQWMATHDNRTRESHQLLNGESIPIGEEFGNGLMYPGDPDGDPEEYYNCRCSLVRNLIGFRRADGSVNEVGKLSRYEPDYFNEKNLSQSMSEEKTKIPNNEPRERIEVTYPKWGAGTTFERPGYGSIEILEFDEYTGDPVVSIDGRNPTLMNYKDAKLAYENSIRSGYLTAEQNARVEELVKAEMGDNYGTDSRYRDDITSRAQGNELAGFSQEYLQEKYEKYKDFDGSELEKSIALAQELGYEKANQDNFFQSSVGTWRISDDQERAADYESHTRGGGISSRYWYTEEGVYRQSDHWGVGVASCSWFIEGREYDNYGVTKGEWETAFIHWTDFIAKTTIKQMPNGMYYARGNFQK